MGSELYLAFVAATAALILIPGPNVALIVGTSIERGARFGLLTVCGTTCAMLVQLAMTIMGLSGVLALLADWFEWLRWAGVAYLVYLGIAAWRTPPADLGAVEAERRAPLALVLRGFLVSLTNPKTLLFYAAFLPQFIDAHGERTPQLILLAATFVVIAATLDSLWAVLAGKARPLLLAFGSLVNRLTGVLLISAAVGLALARRP